jgi:cation diffusion facilitator CzcD-associated flavoprotein CzcO
MDKDKVEIAIIGAGFGGIGAAIKLKQAGFSKIKIFDKSKGFGGTWRENTYPGAACDVMSHLYSFSFYPKSDWSKSYGPQKEILEYINDAAKHFGIDQYLIDNCEITSVVYEDERWVLYTKSKEIYYADVVISALGQLNKPVIPEFAGLGDFQGKYFHSAKWDHNVSLQGKNVSVIGNAASAIQLIPPVSEIAKTLRVFQRTPNWMVPKKDIEFSQLRKNILSKVPFAERIYRTYLYWWHEIKFMAFINNSFAAKKAEQLSKRYLYSKIKDPELRKVLTPNYPLGCKRILLTDNYYETLLKDNVELVTSGIDKFEEKSIVTKDKKRYQSDVVIFATGFNASEFISPVEVIGKESLALNKVWDEGAYAYLGIGVPGFPNFFMLYGPNTNLAHNSIIFMLECQIHYIVSVLNHMSKNGIKLVEPRAYDTQKFNERMQSLMKKTVWVGGCSSWYQNASGKVVNNWPRSTVSYWVSTRWPRYSAFDFTYGELVR